MDNAIMMLIEIDSEYPNIQNMIDSLGDSEKQLALLFLSMLDGESVANIERQMPNILSAHESGDTDALSAILGSFGMDESSIGMVLETRENAMQNAHD